MSRRFTDTDKYKKQFIRGLQGPYKLLWDYLYHDCNHAGIWHVDFEIAQLYLGADMSVNKDDALKYFNADEERIIEVGNGRKWYIPPFIVFQYGTLNPDNRVHSSVIHALRKDGISEGHIRALQGPKDKDKDKDKEDVNKNSKGNRTTIPPKIEDVEDYCLERGKGIDANRWHDHYTANGWKVGKNKMKDWKAAVRTWEKEKGDQHGKARSEPTEPGPGKYPSGTEAES